MGEKMKKTFTIRGFSGTEYQFTKYDINDTFYPLPAVYIYVNSKCELIPDYPHPFVYIGETENLNQRMSDHINKNDDGEHICAMKNGADYLLIHYAPNPFQMRGIEGYTPKKYVECVERDLLQCYNTPCNTKNNKWAEKKSS